MSDTEVATQPTEDQTPKLDDMPAWARREIARRDERIASLETSVRSRTFEAAGIDTSKGLGAKIHELYEGPVDNTEALVEFAKEFEYPFSQPPPQSVPEKVNDPDQRMNAVMETSTPVVSDATPEGQLDERIAKAEQEGNWQLAAELKTQRFPHPG